MKKQITFTKEEQASAIISIAEDIGKFYEGEPLDLWGNISSKSVTYSESREEYAELYRNPNYVHITDLSCYEDNIYFVYDEDESEEKNIKNLIESNYLTDYVY